MIKIALWLIPWLPILLVSFVVYGYFHPQLIDDDPWPIQHPFAFRVMTFVILTCYITFFLGIILMIVCVIRRLFVKSDPSA